MRTGKAKPEITEIQITDANLCGNRYDSASDTDYVIFRCANRTIQCQLHAGVVRVYAAVFSCLRRKETEAAGIGCDCGIMCYRGCRKSRIFYSAAI